jgi:hypothetical protein
MRSEPILPFSFLIAVIYISHRLRVAYRYHDHTAVCGFLAHCDISLMEFKCWQVCYFGHCNALEMCSCFHENALWLVIGLQNYVTKSVTFWHGAHHCFIFTFHWDNYILWKPWSLSFELCMPSE